MANEQQRAATPAAAAYAEPAKPETVAQQFDELKKDAVAWIGKCMRGAKVDGKQLPAFDLLDPANKKQYAEIVGNKEFAETKDLLAQRLRSWTTL